MTLGDLSGYGLLYLATPYSLHPQGQQFAFEEAARVAGNLVNRGLYVFSPITHGHPMSVFGGVPALSHNLWLRFDAMFIEACGALLVVQLDGWRKSFGIAAEVQKFKAAGKPIFYCDPETLNVDVGPVVRICGQQPPEIQSSAPLVIGEQ